MDMIVGSANAVW